ncbi:MAG: hypothetical protein U0835_19270 [Isosphaeraceae bacterium]
MHWSAGYSATSPTYTLGNLFAARSSEKAKADLGDLPGAFARGDYSGLLAWLREKFTSTASATGRPPWWSGSPAARRATCR